MSPEEKKVRQKVASKKYYDKHKDKVLATQAVHRAGKRDEISAYNKAYYDADPERGKARAKESYRKSTPERKAAGRAYHKTHRAHYHGLEKARIAKNDAWVNELKKAPCSDCGGRFEPCCMDFDHLPGADKLMEVSALRGSTREKLEAEIAKCELVCANCHRIRTRDRRNAAPTA